jgi:energy-coupling factor transporter ATP-binding protein EcfA2
MNPDFLTFGHRASPWAAQQPFGLGVADARHHTYLVGRTGTGKSTLLRNLALQLLHTGHGFALIDPHGDLVNDVLRHYPPWRADHLVWFDPADTAFPVGLNPLFHVPPDLRPLVTDGLVSSFKSLWRDSWGPRMEYILANSLAALLDCQNVTLLGVQRMLADDAYRAWVVRQVRDPQVRFFWEQEFGLWDERFRREAVSPIQNKLGQFLLHPAVRHILGQVAIRVDFRFTLDTGRVFLANLSKGRLGPEKANLLGSLLVTQFQLAAMSRADTPEEQRRDFFLLIDEFHNFTTDAFAVLLAEARKYRLNLVLAHQYLDQLALPVRQAVFGNVGTLVSFRVGHGDAEALAGEFGGAFAPAQFADLPRHHVLVRLLDDAQPCAPFQGFTLPPLEPKGGDQHRLKARSRERFAKDRMEVESGLRRWAASARPTPMLK